MKFKIYEKEMWNKTISEMLSEIEQFNNTFIFIDTETTGLGGSKHQQLTQISAIAIDSNFKELNNYNEKILLTDETIEKLDEKTSNSSWTKRKTLDFNHYYDSIDGKEYLEEQYVLSDFFNWIDKIDNPILVMQNAEFDMEMLSGRSGKDLSKYTVLDTKYFLQLYIIPIYQKLSETNTTYKEKLERIGISSRDNGLITSSMGKWAPEFDIDTTSYHDALFDCEMTIKMYKNILKIMSKYKNLDIKEYQDERINSRNLIH